MPAFFQGMAQGERMKTSALLLPIGLVLNAGALAQGTGASTASTQQP
jgi:hypothetical protein